MKKEEYKIKEELSNIELEKMADIRYLALQYNEFCKKWNGRGLTPEELNKVENLLRYGEKCIMNYEQKNGNITIDRETARVLNSAVAIYKSHLINELCLENDKKQKDMRQILYIENSLCEAVQIGQELQKYVHTPIDDEV